LFWPIPSKDLRCRVSAQLAADEGKLWKVIMTPKHKFEMSYTELVLPSIQRIAPAKN